MEVSLIVNDSRIVGRLDAIGPTVRKKLVENLTPISDEMTSEAKSLAEAHIRFLGTKPGQYVASIMGGVSTKHPTRVTGYLRSGSPLAHLLEGGAQTPAHTILPKVATILAFQGDAGTVFARRVNHPGATIPPYPALGPAFNAHRSEAEQAIIQAGRDGVKANP